MGFKVAGVRGLSQGLRHPVPRGAGPAALAGRLRLPLLRPSGALRAGRGLYQCNRCKKQTSPTAGTIFHATKLPLTLWFAAIHLVVTAKNGISGGTRPPSRGQAGAWAVKDGGDGAARGGDGAYGAGRWTTPISAECAPAASGAAARRARRWRRSRPSRGAPGKLKLAPVKGFRNVARSRAAPSTGSVVTDGLGCWSALDEAACSHQAIRTGSGRQAARMASSRARSPGLIASSAPTMPDAISPASPGATTGAINSRQ